MSEIIQIHSLFT